jgi:hypothetical protein
MINGEHHVPRDRLDLAGGRRARGGSEPAGLVLSTQPGGRTGPPDCLGPQASGDRRFGPVSARTDLERQTGHLRRQCRRGRRGQQPEHEHPRRRQRPDSRRGSASDPGSRQGRLARFTGRHIPDSPIPVRFPAAPHLGLLGPGVRRRVHLAGRRSADAGRAIQGKTSGGRASVD